MTMPGVLGPSVELDSALGARTRELPELDSAALLGLLYRQLRALAGPRRELDDLVQAAAERLLRALPHFRHDSKFSTFAYSVAYRTLLDHDRWYRRQARRLFHLEDRPSAEPIAEDDAESTALAARRARVLYEALDRLPPEKRAVVVLYELEGFTATEIATITGSSEGTVRSRLRDGKARLTQLLAEHPLFASAEGSAR
jgi:RNA polymerase sigma-70 factor (ECF subfamily)